MDSEDEMLSAASSLGDDFDADESDNESLFDDASEEDVFSQGSKSFTEVEKPAYQVDFDVLSPEDIQNRQDKQIKQVSELLEQPPEATAILLRHMRWNGDKLQNEFWDKQQEILEAAGLQEDEAHVRKIETLVEFSCPVCFEDEDDVETYALKCAHRYCTDCYKNYLISKVRDEGEAARIQCPTPGCNRVVDTKSMEMLLPEDMKARYHDLLTRTYVDDKDDLKWCPAPNCEYAVSCKVKKKDLNKVIPSVACKCKHSFCFGCGLDDHLPCPCDLVKKWTKKCADDSETANWINTYTKECPKCASTIEKNGGCNHMTCRKCKNEFCWMCMGAWSEHGTAWYNCSRFEEKSGVEARDAQAKSRQSLERYLHYFHRFANHEQSAKLGQDAYLKAEKQMTNLQNASGLSWIEVQYLHDGNNALQNCRQTLKWTYAFAFYLARNNLTEIFETNQKDLEVATENLNAALEKQVTELAASKIEILDLTSYCRKRRHVLLTETAKSLKKGEWEFNELV